MAYLVKNLSAQQRLAIESLLGRNISEKESIAIRAYEPPPALSQEKKAEVIAGLEAHFAAADASHEPVSAEEAEAVFEEAMRSSRTEYRTHR